MAVPSVVYLDDQLVIGQPAVRRATTEPSRVAREFKRRVGDPTPLILDGTPMPAEMLMARVLAWVVEQVTSTEGAAPDSLALCHPANWGTYKLELCGYMYDEVSTSGLGFEEFNEAWTAVDVDPSHPGTQALESAVFSCSGAAGGLEGTG